MSDQDTQDRVIPSVPVGTPGRDTRAALPAWQPPGAQLAWRRHGPGNRTWVVVVTALAAVFMVVIGVAALAFGTFSTAFDRSGAVVLTGAQFRTSDTSCTGTGAAEQVHEGARIEFRNSSNDFSARLGTGVLRGGGCLFPFELSALDVSADHNYQVSVGGVSASPVSGAELMNSTDPVLVYVGRR